MRWHFSLCFAIFRPEIVLRRCLRHPTILETSLAASGSRRRSQVGAPAAENALNYYPSQPIFSLRCPFGGILRLVVVFAETVREVFSNLIGDRKPPVLYNRVFCFHRRGLYWNPGWFGYSDVCFGGWMRTFRTVVPKHMVNYTRPVFAAVHSPLY